MADSSGSEWLEAEAGAMPGNRKSWGAISRMILPDQYQVRYHGLPAAAN